MTATIKGIAKTVEKLLPKLDKSLLNGTKELNEVPIGIPQQASDIWNIVQKYREGIPYDSLELNALRDLYADATKLSIIGVKGPSTAILRDLDGGIPSLTATTQDINDYLKRSMARYELATMHVPDNNELLETLDNSAFQLATKGSVGHEYVFLPDNIGNGIWLNVNTSMPYSTVGMDILPGTTLNRLSLETIFGTMNSFPRGTVFAPVEFARAPHLVLLIYSDLRPKLADLVFWDYVLNGLVPINKKATASFSTNILRMLGRGKISGVRGATIPSVTARLHGTNSIGHNLSRDANGDIVVPKGMYVPEGTPKGAEIGYYNEFKDFRPQNGIYFRNMSPEYQLLWNETVGKLYNVPIENNTVPLNMFLRLKNGGKTLILIPRNINNLELS